MAVTGCWSMSAWHTPEQLAVPLEIARGRLYPGQGQLDLGIDPDSSGGPATITSKSCAVLWQVLTGAYQRLGFDALGDESFKQLVLARIVEPTSKADSLRDRGRARVAAHDVPGPGPGQRARLPRPDRDRLLHPRRGQR